VRWFVSKPHEKAEEKRKKKRKIRVQLFGFAIVQLFVLD